MVTETKVYSLMMFNDMIKNITGDGMMYKKCHLVTTLI